MEVTLFSQVLKVCFRPRCRVIKRIIVGRCIYWNFFNESNGSVCRQITYRAKTKPVQNDIGGMESTNFNCGQIKSIPSKPLQHVVLLRERVDLSTVSKYYALDVGLNIGHHPTI